MNDILMNLKIVAKILNSLKRKVDKLVFDMLKTVATGLTKFPAGKYWSPGHPEDVPKDPIWPSGDIPIWRPGEVLISRPGDVLKWRPGDVLIWRSRDVPGRLIRDVPRTFSGRPLEDLESTQTWMSNFFLTFLSELIRLTKSKSISTLKVYWEPCKTSKMEHFLQN